MAETIGDFEIVREIGRGGMGVVYEARQRSLNRRVALKVLLGIGRSNPNAVERFRREASSAAKLTHPNIIQVYAFGEENGHHYIAMEYVDGPSLDRVLVHGRCPDLAESGFETMIAGDETLPMQTLTTAPMAPPCPDAGVPRLEKLDRYVRILIDTARALHAAHEVGVLHRDVKPGNILIDSDGHVKLADFGLARKESAGDTVTASGEVLGTLAYMSPEQVAPKRVPVTRRADVYALGVTLYEILVGRRPFEHATAHVVMHMIQTTEPPKPRKLEPAVPKDLEIICLKAMDKDPERRYATALELAEDLERYLRDEPILARPASTLTRIVRFVRRRKVPVAASLLLAAAGIVIIALLQRDRAKDAEAKARQLAWNKETAKEKLEHSLMRSLGGQATEALAMLDEAEQLDPSLADVYLQRGLLHFNMDQADKALADVDTGLAKSPTDAALLFARGTILRAIGREDDARQSLDAAHLETVQDALRLTALGMFQTTNGWARDAVKTLELAKRQNPLWPQSRFGLAIAHYRLRRYDSALEVLKTFLDLDPGHPVGYALLVMLHVSRAESADGSERASILRDARAALAELQRVAPGEPLTVGVEAALAAFDPGEQGRAALTSALARVDQSLAGKGSGPLRVSGGIVYEVLAQLAMGVDKERARGYANEALRIRRNTDTARVVLADLDLLAGKRDEARARYREVYKEYQQAPLAPARLLAMRTKDVQCIPDDEAAELVDMILETKPEDPDMLLTAADAAATIPSRRAQARELYQLARTLYLRRANEEKVGLIAARKLL